MDDMRPESAIPRTLATSRASAILVAVLAANLALCRAAPLHARSNAEGTFAVGRASIMEAWLRHSGTAARDLTGFPADGEKISRELSRLADRLRPAVASAKDGKAVVNAFRRVLLKEEGYRYDSVPGNPDNFLSGGVVARKQGNCLGLSLLWLSLAERLGVPFRGVYVPGHCFVRYEGEGSPLNVEFAASGASWDDETYLGKFRLAEKGPYLRSLSNPEMLAVFLKSVGAAYAGKGRHAEALVLYAEAERLYPGLPDVHYNAGVSLQRLGRPDEAIAKYRKALSLDPNMVVARGNLASSYAACGRYDEGVSEYQKAVEAEPTSRQAREGLTRAWFAKGDYPAAAKEAERAEALGCRFEPSLLEALEPFRERRGTEANPLP